MGTDEMARSTTPAMRSVLRRGAVLALPVGLLAIGTVAMLPRHDAPALPGAGLLGKVSDRLAFVGEDVPTREGRIFDTLATFALPVAAASGWSDAPTPTLAVVSRTADTTRLQTAKRGSAALPRMAQAEAEVARVPALPPSRPIRPAEAAAAEPQPVVAAAEAPADVRLLGVRVPGTGHLPSGRATLRKVADLGEKAAELGIGTAAALGNGVADMGRSVAGAVGWR